jgi:hypothetical protein
MERAEHLAKITFLARILGQPKHLNIKQLQGLLDL